MKTLLFTSCVFVGLALAACGGSDSSEGARASDAGGDGAGAGGESSGGRGGGGTGSGGIGTGGVSGGAGGVGTGGGGASGAGAGGLATGGRDAGAHDGSLEGGAIRDGSADGAILDGGDAGPTCDFGAVASAGTNQNLDLFGTIVYFNDGAVLPAGHYRVTYVDGCMKYSSGQDWTIHAYADGSDGWWLVGDTTADKITMPPGTVGYVVSNGAYATFDECVAANKALPPKEFDFAGGKIGVWLQDSPYTDNLAGQDNRNPKWQLTLLGSCRDK